MDVCYCLHMHVVGMLCTVGVFVFFAREEGSCCSFHFFLSRKNSALISCLQKCDINRTD